MAPRDPATLHPPSPAATDPAAAPETHQHAPVPGLHRPGTGTPWHDVPLPIELPEHP